MSLIMRIFRHKLRSSLAWLLVLVCTSTTCMASARALSEVLCIGADGHVGIEYAVLGDCADRDGHLVSDQGTSREQNSVVTSSGHCGSCFDVAITRPAGPSPRVVLVAAPLDVDFKPFLLDTFIAPGHLSLTHLHSLRVAYDEISPRRMLRERRSVVLNI